MRLKAIVSVAGVALAATFVLSPASAGAYAAGNPTVVSDRQAALDVYGATLASPVQPNTQIEPSIAVNPGDSNDVVTAFQVGRVDAGGDADNGFGTSLDGGLHWTYGNLPGLTKSAPTPVLTPNLCTTDPNNPEAFDRASDAVVTFGADPTGHAFHGYFVYAQSLVFDDTTCNALPSGMALNVSSDGGVTWTNALIVETDPGGGLNDKNWIVTDNSSATGHHRGRTYIVWDRVASVEVAYCDPDSSASLVTGTGCDKITNWSSAGGHTFFPLFPGQGIGTMPVVLNNGSLGVMFESLTAACSPTEGANCPLAGSQIEWGVIPGAGLQAWPGPFTPTTFAPITVASCRCSGVEFQRAGTLPQVAYDTVTGDAVVGWEDNRYRTDASGAPGNQNDAVMSFSTPIGGPSGVPGATWSAPARINQGATGDFIDHWNTTVAIGADGIWRFGYRQRFEPNGMSPTAPSIDTYYQESRDQGTTFTSPLKVNTSISTDPQFGAFSRNGLFLGDYQQMAAGGNDETYVTRDESFAPSVGATCNTGPFTTVPASPCQNQTTYVAHLLPAVSASTPEVRFLPGLLLGGASVVVAGLVRNRRRRRA